MLISQPHRPPEWKHFVTEVPEYKTGTKQLRAELLVFEWMSNYTGQVQGPLDRHSPDKWARAFLSVGHFEAEHTITEASRNEFQETLELHRVDDSPEPDGDLWRAAVPQNARRWSWFDGPSPALQRMGDDALRLYRCRTPIHVFGSITTHYRLWDDTDFWELSEQAGAGLGGDLDDYTEFVAIPSDVTEMTVTDPGPHSSDLHLTPRRLL
jgi:hypothetical protein